MKYTCKICSYKTGRKIDLTRHNNTLRHLEKVAHAGDASIRTAAKVQLTEITMYKCAYCENTYVSQSNRSKHMKTCSQKAVQEKDDKIKEIVKEKDAAIKEIIQEKNEAIKQKDVEIKDLVIDNLKKENDNLKKNYDDLKKDKQKLQEQLDLFGEILKASSSKSYATVNNITYITNTYPNAPELKQLESYKHILEAKTLSLIDVLYLNYEKKY